jgi:S-adenosylmethionine:diacylglycerol 3-amino-3-carboxypropyl transferase
MIYYSHVNEDNRVERKIMQERAYTTLYTVAGSGERVIALLDHPTLKTVHLLDNNWEALYLCELKITALTHLSAEAYLGFVGFYPDAGSRWAQFYTLQPFLSDNCWQYWVEKKHTIKKGICFCGHFEQFLQRANPFLRFFLGRNFYQCFSTPKADWKHFPAFRWQLVKMLFSFRLTYKMLGMKDTAFISNDADLKTIPAALQKSLDMDTARESCLFHLVFNGNLDKMPEAFLPPSFQQPVLQRIKTALRQDQLKVIYHYGDALSLLETFHYEPMASRFFSFSDLLSFANMDYMDTLIKLVTRIKNGSNTLVFRAFVRNRLKKDQIIGLQHKYGKVVDLTAEERTHFYQVFEVNI